MIYIDGSLMCADTTAELHAFAREMKLPRLLYRQPPAHDFGHYKVWGNVRKLIMRDERVKYVSKQELPDLAKQMK